jgi:putative Holliday junction resolvase
MKILGIDYGLKKIGLAISEGELAEPLGVINAIRNTQYAIRKIKAICGKYDIDKIVVGLPESGIVDKIKHFAGELAKITGLPVVFQDEVLTSKDAIAKMIEGGRKRKFRRQFQDAVAAAIILQSYMDAKTRKKQRHKNF